MRLGLLLISLMLPIFIVCFVKFERWHSHQMVKALGNRRCMRLRNCIFSPDVILPVYDYILWLCVLSAGIRASLDLVGNFSDTVTFDSNKWWFWLIWGFGLQGSREFLGSVVAFVLVQRSSGQAAFRRAAIGAGLMLTIAGLMSGILVWKLKESSSLLFLLHDTLATSVYLGILTYMLFTRRRRWRTLYLYVGLQLVVNLLYVVGSASKLGDQHSSFHDELCFWTAGDLLVILAQPIAILIALRDDSRYWRSLATVVGAAGTRSDASVFEGAINRVSRRSFAQLQEFLAMEIRLLDFAKLEILDPLGSGATASVFKASYGNEELALKSLDFQELTADVVRSYCQEAILSFRLSHRNIVRFFGVCLRPPELFLVFEFCRKGSLRDVLDSPMSLPIATRVQLALDVAEGMAFLHQQKIVHRDLKSQNVLVQFAPETGSLVAKVADFGLSRIILPRSPDNNRNNNMAKGSSTQSSSTANNQESNRNNEKAESISGVEPRQQRVGFTAPLAKGHGKGQNSDQQG
eukprot:jgi/Bigna1/77113/fgenesh1_pg.45_\